MLSSKLKYFLWAASRVGQENSCPACGSQSSRLVHKKYLVTSLRECSQCQLRFRTPTNRGDARRFYEEEYAQGFTTECPTDAELKEILARNFAGTNKDYATYIQVLKTAGLQPGASILDFGASWGYGSWQLRRAGFSVYSYEISRPRSEYAREKLQCHTLSDWHELPGPVDCLFSAHVIEHLENPNLLWDVAREFLKPGGLFVCFCPNGNPNIEEIRTSHLYHKLWGNVHPLLITPEFLRRQSAERRYVSAVYSSPYDFDRIASRKTEPDPLGDELLLLGWQGAAA
jgi:2-polyprenyl-3-methyl-5-hydroxy-6-metoxy-1,4-benzoquinol methylase